MQPLSSAIEAREFETVRRGGYDADQVDEFMRHVTARALELEEQITAAHSKINALQRQIDGTKEAESAVGIAFLAAADAKHHLIEDAEKRATEIIDRARRESETIRAPDPEMLAMRSEAKKILEEAKRRYESADTEAEDLLRAARKQAERTVAEARRDAIAAIEESKRDAQEWLDEARNEHQRLSLMLRGLKSAVREMLEEAEDSRPPIRLVLEDEIAEVEPTGVQLPG